MSQPQSTLNVLDLGVRAAIYIMFSLLLVAAVGLTGLRLRGQQVLSVQSPSMSPTFNPGDALVVEPVPIGQLRVGDIVSYKSYSDPAVIISHRLVAIDMRASLLTTAGDNNRTPDRPFPLSRLVGRATHIAPGLGRIMDLVRTPLGLALALYLPAAYVIAGEIRHLASKSARI